MPEDERLDAILAQWYERRDSGEDVSPEDVLREHPDLAEALRARFRAEDLLDEAFGEALELPAGTPRKVGDFHIVRELGRGGMGVVYEAEQTPMRRRVALKILSPAITGTGHAVKRFQREAQAAGRLHHTNIVPIHAMGQHAGYWYYAMELVEGRPLSDVIAQLRRAGKPTEESLGRAAAGEAPRSSTRIEELGTDTGDRSYFLRVAETFAGVADALQLAHADRIVHRDLKPGNLLLDADGTLKIVDFGLARVDEAGAPSMTMTGDLLGTPVYMSPEQAMAKRIAIDHRTDIYSLGATLYEVLTLRPPFDGKSLQEICTQIITKDPALPRRRNHKIPRDLETIVLKAMEKDRDKRYQTAGEFARDLRRFAEGGAIRARRIGPVGRSWRRIKRHKVRSSLVAAVVLVTFVGGLQWRRAARAEALRREGEYEQLILQIEAMLGSQAGSIRSIERGTRGLAGELLAQAIDLVPDRAEAYWLRALDLDQPIARRLDDLDNALARDLPKAQYHLTRAWLLRSEGDTKAADREVMLAGADRTGEAIESYFDARLRLRAGERDQALELFSRAIADGDDGSLPERLGRWWRGRVRLAGGEYERALEDLLKLEDQAEIRVWIAVAWRRLGKAELAEAQFAEILQAGGDRLAWSALCLACERAREFDWYERASARSVEVCPEDAALLALRAKALVAVGRAEEGLRFCDRALATAPNHHLVHNAHCLALLHTKRFDEAVRAGEQAIASDPACGCGHCLKGYALGHLEKHEEALAAFARALELNAGLGLAHIGQAAVWMRQKDYDQALAALERATRLQPGPAFAERAHLLIHLERFPEAHSDLAQALRFVSPDSVDAAPLHGYRAEILDTEDKTAEAIAAAEHALGLDPECVPALAAKGSSLVREFRAREAIVPLQEAVRLAPSHVPAHINLGIAHLDDGRPDKALQLLGQAEGLCESAGPPALPRFLLLIRYHSGRALLRMGKHIEALAALNDALERHRAGPARLRPDLLAQVHHERGNALAALGRVAEALTAHIDSLKLAPRFAIGYYNKGCALGQLGRSNEALAAFEKARELDPGLARAHFQVGSALLDDPARLADALEALDKAIELEDGYALAHYNQGQVLRRMGRIEDAIEAFGKAIERDPNYFHSHNNQGALLYRLGRYGEALRAFNKTIELKDDYALAHLNRGNALGALKRFAEALDAYDRAIELGFRPPALLNRVAWMRATWPDPQLRDIPRAVEMARLAVRLAPADAGVWNTLGVALYRAGKWRESAQALQKSMGLPSGDGVHNWLFLAMAMHKLGEEDARKWYDKAVAWMEEHRPDDDERAEAEEVLGIDPEAE
ncbi:MAG: tetratricopeptide repeat protein [Planctomycetota bacterium]|jgi:tetratricopeptide (TPR) repeat protein